MTTTLNRHVPLRKRIRKSDFVLSGTGQRSENFHVQGCCRCVCFSFPSYLSLSLSLSLYSPWDHVCERTAVGLSWVGLESLKPMIRDWIDDRMEKPAVRDQRFKEHMDRVAKACQAKLRETSRWCDVMRWDKCDSCALYAVCVCVCVCVCMYKCRETLEAPSKDPISPDLTHSHTRTVSVFLRITDVLSIVRSVS